MTTTGTFAFNPSLGGLGLYALGKCQIRRASVLPEHLSDVQMAANLILADWGTQQPRLWNIALNSMSLSLGQTIVTIPTNAILVTDAYLTIGAGPAATDRILYPVSRGEYAAFPNKNLQQPPSVYWFNRTIPGTLNLYPAVDANGPYVLNYYTFNQDEDAALANAATLDIPVWTLRAFADELAAELATSYAPQMAQGLALRAAATKARMDAQDREVVTIYVAPTLGGYYR